MTVRGKTWIAAPFASKSLLEWNPSGGHYDFTEEEKAKFASDPKAYKAFRSKLEAELNSVHGATMRDHPLQKGARAAFKDSMESALAKKPWIAEHMIPDFPVACRRCKQLYSPSSHVRALNESFAVTPGPGYLAALVEDNVEFCPDAIKRITETGIETVDGRHRRFDSIITATGFDTSFKPRHPIIGLGGANLQDEWAEYPT